MTMRHAQDEYGYEPTLIAIRWGLRPGPVKKWLAENGMAGSLDFRTRFPGTWKESNDAALADFWKWAMK